MDNERLGSTNSEAAPSPLLQPISPRRKGLGAQAGAALSKVREAARQAGSHVKEAGTSLSAKAGEKAKGLIGPVGSAVSFLSSAFHPAVSGGYRRAHAGSGGIA
jgi:hypothetical protein